MGFDNDLFLKGKDAELVILDPKERWKFPEKYYSKSKILLLLERIWLEKLSIQ